MDAINRKQLDRIAELLQNHINTEESIKLADVLKNADIIPKLYQAAYIESINMIVGDVKTIDELKAKTKYHFDYGLSLTVDGNALEAVKAIAFKAHERQDDICDFADSPLPENKIGSCGYEEHYEDIFDRIELNDKERKKFDRLNDKHGYYEACVMMGEKLNPSDQHLTLILEFGSDESKCKKDDGYYVCDSCLEVISENSDGGISCDVEMAEQ